MMREFEKEEPKVRQHLVWLVGQAARLKALAADTMFTVKDALDQKQPPPELLEPFPLGVLVSRGVRTW